MKFYLLIFLPCEYNNISINSIVDTRIMIDNRINGLKKSRHTHVYQSDFTSRFGQKLKKKRPLK